MTIFNLNSSELTLLANQARESYLTILFREKIITQKQLDEMSEYVIVVTEPNMFGKFWNKFRRKEQKNPVFSIVHDLSPTLEEKDTEEYEQD